MCCRHAIVFVFKYKMVKELYWKIFSHFEKGDTVKLMLKRIKWLNVRHIRQQ